MWETAPFGLVRLMQALWRRNIVDASDYWSVVAVALFDKMKSIFKPGGGKLDVSARFDFQRHAIHGTMSTFRAAKDRATGKDVGVKLLDEEEFEKLESRFKSNGLAKPHEGEIGIQLTQLSHPNLVETYEYGVTTKGQPYVIMQYIEGPALTALIRDQNPQLMGRRVDLIRQMADAIEAVHDAGFIHRDICPKNFICNPTLEHVTLFDFGVTVPDTPEFRQPGVRTGTPRYMAPEIVRRRATDKRVDVFSFGVAVYQFLTFAHPWPGEDLRGTAALAFDTVPPTDIFKVRPDINKTLAQAIVQCMSPNPDERPDSMAAFKRLIRKVESETEDPG